MLSEVVPIVRLGCFTMTQQKRDELVVVLGAKQVGLALFMLVLTIGTFGAVTYVVGRMVVPLPAAADADRNEQVLVVESAGGPVSDPIEAPVLRAGTKPKPPAKPVAAKVSPKAAPAPERTVSTADKVFINASSFREPTPGQVFLQVAAADRGVAEVFAEYLTRRAFPVQIGRGADERSWRVLVGPMRDNAQIAAARSRLEDAGFHPFVRRYKKQPEQLVASRD